ncbi:hypothetical protein FNT36_18125 [Hymenobacter setariae]|uniref:Uncharacterized protein n=1 Tax=Hymenobacter setariae TaxID=2594794 RepID=A0A558BSU2_9BACT|nr:hypothetical protein [Hymenobacter setariae]TVT39561.1 hypothetical protein FNT36_18125 [Hymenobacter setariae]
MKLFDKMRAMFTPKPVVIPPTPLYSDEEFLEFIAAQARKRTQEEQAALSKPANPAAPLGNAA